MKPTADSSWCIEQEGFDPTQERVMETIFTIGNGYMGVRGALSSPIPASQTDLFIGGIYDRKAKTRPYSEVEFLAPERQDLQHVELVSFPFPFIADLNLNPENIIYFKRNLDLKQGILFIEASYSDETEISDENTTTLKSGRTIIRSSRFASMHDPHLLWEELEFHREGPEREFEIKFMDEMDHPAGQQLRHPHLTRIQSSSDDPSSEKLTFNLKFRTSASNYEIGIGGNVWKKNSEERIFEKLSSSLLKVTLSAGKTLKLRRVIAVVTSRDESPPALDRGIDARITEKLQGLEATELEDQLDCHLQEWDRIWEKNDIIAQSNASLSETHRFNAYHLMIAAPRESHYSMGARTLSGRGYEGHVFWDTEIFILPFFLYTHPHVARNLLTYRYHTLEGARRRARDLGYNGACFAWESTVTGEDVTPQKIMLRSTGQEVPIVTGTQQVHVTADIAYSVRKYWDATKDDAFLIDHGAEILIETSRFWVSRCALGKDHHHIHEVVGPDEYHHGISDNAYTNGMARHNLRQGVWIMEWLRANAPEKLKELRDRLMIKSHEVEQWREIADTLYFPTPNSAGVIEQFKGFFDLEDFSIPQEQRLKAPINRLFEWKRINRMKVIKQADVLMLMYLLPQDFDLDAIKANYAYYEPITDHGSSLSPSIHAIIAAWIGNREDCRRYYHQARHLDQFNLMHNTGLGIHAACMGGAWQVLIFGILGIQFTDSGPRLSPESKHRATWIMEPVDQESENQESGTSDRHLALKLTYRGKAYSLQVIPEKLMPFKKPGAQAA